ncbi:hypothetical protein VM1G_12033 [Cytospora mali]|uniref:Uncharacterized protein n=1 Tax=Cytospora mali TaxID=578113 RepID=A0A194VIE7_CYTMA|nr:hypothetical protein VM1G_12033 [Valsa mali]
MTSFRAPTWQHIGPDKYRQAEPSDHSCTVFLVSAQAEEFPYNSALYFIVIIIEHLEEVTFHLQQCSPT